MSRVRRQWVLGGAEDIAGLGPEREELRSWLIDTPTGVRSGRVTYLEKLGGLSGSALTTVGAGPKASSASLWRDEMRRRADRAPTPRPRPALMPPTSNERRSNPPPSIIRPAFQTRVLPATTVLSSRSPNDCVLGRAPAQGRAGGSQGLSGGLAVDSGAGAAENWARGGPMVALERLTGGLPDLQHSPRKSGERLTDEHGRREGRYR